MRNQSGEQRDDARREEAAGPAGSAAERGLGHPKWSELAPGDT